MTAYVPYGSNIDRQLHRSNSFTFDRQQVDRQPLAETQTLNRHNSFQKLHTPTVPSRQEYLNGQNKLMQEFQTIMEESHHGSSRSESFGVPWQQNKMINVKSGPKILELKTIETEGNSEDRDVQSALQSLKNYQLNVVVDLNDIIMSDLTPSEKLTDTTQSFKKKTDSQAGYFFGKPRLSKESVHKENSMHSNSFSYQSPKNMMEGARAIAEKYKNLEGSYKYLKKEIEKLQVRQKKEQLSVNDPFNNDTLTRIRHKNQLRGSINNSSFQSNQYLKESLAATNDMVQQLKQSNQQLQCQLEEIYRVNIGYKKDAEESMFTIRELYKQVEGLKSQLVGLQQRNEELEYHVLNNRKVIEEFETFKQERSELGRLNQMRMLLQRDDEVNEDDPRDEHIRRLQLYIRNLEDQIDSQNNAKEVFMNDIMGYKMSFARLEEQNKRLNERVRYCVVQHMSDEDYNALTSSETEGEYRKEPASNEQDPNYVSPLEKYGVPRLIISPPVEEAN